MFQQEFPTRSRNHISETASFKIFNNHIPNHWIVRGLSERDYGLDALIEPVSDNNQVTGDLISIQLKSTARIKFDSTGKFRFFNVRKSTTNYWINIKIPTFIFLVDESEQKIFYKSIKDYLRVCYDRYNTEDNFYYDFFNYENFTLQSFLESYQRAKNIPEIDEELSTVTMLHKSFSELYYKNIRRDYHMLVDDDDVLSQFHHVNESIRKLCYLLNIPWNLPTIEQYVKENNIGCNANYNNYFIYEYHLTEFLIMLDRKLLDVLVSCKKIVCEEHYSYWHHKQPQLIYFLNNFLYKTLEDQYFKRTTV